VDAKLIYISCNIYRTITLYDHHKNANVTIMYDASMYACT